MSRNLALVVVLFAGCVSDASVSDADAEGGLEIDGESGAIAGIVTDQELVPLPGAEVTIAALGLTAEAGQNATFRFGPVGQGAYLVNATLEGYAPRSVEVAVQPGLVSEVHIAMQLLPLNGTYYEIFPFKGFQACQWYTPTGWAHCTWPYTIVHGGAEQQAGVNLTSAGLPRDLMENYQSYNYTVRPDHTAILSEMFWDVTSTASIIERFYQTCGWYDYVIDACWPPGDATWYGHYEGADMSGKSPIRYIWKHDVPAHLPWVSSRATVFGDSEERPVSAAVSQTFEMYNTVFYGEVPPEDFSSGPPDQ